METMKTLTVGNNTYDITDDGAIRFDNAQSLTETQQSQARMNMGIIHDAKYYLNLSTAITDINNGANTNALTDISAAKVKVFTAENGRLTVMLLDDISESAQITINKDIDIVLNGKTLTFTTATAYLYFAANTKCKIDGEAGGKIKCADGVTSTATVQILRAGGEELIVKGGTYEAIVSATGVACCAAAKAGRLVLDGCDIFVHNTGSGKTTAISCDASVVVKNSTVTGIGEQNHACGILTGTDLTVEDSTITARINVPYTKQSGYAISSIGITVDSYFKTICKISNSKIIADARGDNADEPCGVGIKNDYILFLHNTECFGTHSGVSNHGKLYVSGGTFTGHSHGGFYFSHGPGFIPGLDGEAFVKDAVIRCGNYEGIFTENFAEGNAVGNVPYASFYIGGGSGVHNSNVTAYLDGCTIGTPGKPAFAIRSTAGEQNNTVNISNSTIVDGALPIRVDNATHKLNVGIGGNITADKIDNPQWAEFTGKNYRRYTKNEMVDGNGYDALQGQICGVSGDEWFEIADITTTEEVNSFYVDKDKAGNSFVCKKIVARLVSTSALAAGGGIYIGGGGNGVWEEPGIMYNINPSSLVHTWSITDCNGLYHEYVIGRGIAKHFMDTSTAYQVRPEHAGVPLTSFFVGYDEGTKTFPAGVNLKIWGLRA